MNAPEETKVTNVGSQVRHLDYFNFCKKILTVCFIWGAFLFKQYNQSFFYVIQVVDIFLFQHIDKVFNNIGADFLTGGESENKEDGLQNKHKRVSFFTYS